ncbi:NAD-dependent epimerase/dehydratase family protein [Aliarcobacter butzleri]|uniref:NAD-dependent epimerase/dehydratase family protein n=1 Tax=Aliarcobacter butzleri TaxID=28197 RepID=UPI0021B426DC|nr:NAD-dependent epimerase/dehydratase family protein [Aliarcobacter butzleri]MCT7580383.1 NAD-dependent epimerase/dehydratase family protein [Aliarcobacter butzleri]
MKAIITGATGGLGRNLLEFLVLQNWQVVAFGRDEKIGKSLGVEFYAFDLSDFEQTKKNFQKADVVFHCAALSSPWGKYEEFYKANVIATKNVLKAMELFNIKKIVHVSTPSIYFDFQDQFEIKEEFIPTKFVNDYAKTKYQAEQLVLNSSVFSVIIRPRAIFGEYDNVLVPRLEKVALKGFLPIIKNKKTIVDVTYVGNVVNALYLASIKDIPSKSIFNITNDEPMDIQEVFSLLMETIKIKIKFKYISYFVLFSIATILEIISKLGFIKEPFLTKYSVGVISKSQTLDISKAKKILGYKPIYTIKEGLQRYAKYRNL